MSKLIYEHRGHPHIMFYKNSNTPALISMYAKLIVKNLLGNNLISMFRRLEIIFENNEGYKKSDVEGLRVAMGEENGAYVLPKEIFSNKDRIHLSESAIYANVLRKLNFDVRPENERLLEGLLVKTVVQIILHEMTHIWHMRLNDTRKKILRNVGRVDRAYKKMLKEQDLFKGNKNIGEYWINIRKYLFFIPDYIVHEGIAEFFSLYSMNHINFTEQSLGQTYRLAEEHAIKLNKDFNLLYSMFQEFVRIFKGKITNTESANFRDMNSYFQRILTELPNCSYYIGPHIYHMILFQNEKMTLHDLATYDYAKLIKLYEEASADSGLKPLISLRSGDGIFDYGDKVSNLKHLRKKFS